VVTKIIKIGNSRGFVFPGPCSRKRDWAKQSSSRFITSKSLSAPTGARNSWAEAFRLMAARGDDRLPDKENLAGRSSWDDEEWEW